MSVPLPPIPPASPAFLAELVERARRFGHSGDYVEVLAFLETLHGEAGVPLPDSARRPYAIDPVTDALMADPVEP